VLKGVERTETHLSTAGGLLFQAELTLSLQPIIQLKARGSTPVKINLVRSLTDLLVSRFASRSFSCGLLRHHFLRLGCCWLGHRPPPGLRDSLLTTQRIFSHEDLSQKQKRPRGGLSGVPI